MKSWKYLFLFLLIFVLLASHITTSKDLNQDLSRHLKLGEIITKTGNVPDTNLFSYTNQKFSFINHHWLSEVVFYDLTQTFGLNILIVLKVSLIILSVLIVLLTPDLKIRLLPIGFTLLLSPLLMERTDVRPEMFGYFFFAYTLFVLLAFPRYQKLIYALPIVMLLWVNMHITFVFGMFLLSLLTIKIYFHQRKFYTIPSTFYPLLASWLAFLVNPHFIYGAIYPFLIFGNYGYTIVENQNIFFLSTVITNNFITYFFWIAPITVIAAIILLVRQKYLATVLLISFFALAIYQVRHFPFFVLAAIPSLTLAYRSVFDLGHRFLASYWSKIKIGTVVLVSLISLMWAGSLVSNGFYRTFDLDRRFGFGFAENGKKATDFMIANKLPGPIFNNFDIGGELIYRLYPNYKVFVDNRPEAYPAAFLQDSYIQMQYDETLQKQLFAKFGIKTVIFGHNDITPWARAFLPRILADKDWKLVYADQTMIILTIQTSLPDIRDDKNYFAKQISNDNDYISLFHLANILSTLKKDDIANLAFDKASELNPSSCAVNKTKYRNIENSPLFYQADEIKQKYWYCF